MAANDLWKYCTAKQEKEMLRSLRLLDGTSVREDKYLACLYAVSNYVDKHYHEVTVKKKSGGVRRLMVPDALLNTIQKNILHHILDGLATADAAKAYRRGKTIVDNALLHVGAGQIMKLDIQDFFGNITYLHVYQYAFLAVYFPPAVRTMLSMLCCCHDCLPQGAPTSPAVSNLVMKSFDQYMENWCCGRGICYTRYCDDMTFSGSFDIKEVKNKVRSYLRVMGFQLNEKKTKVLRRHCRQTVTGIVVNEKPQASRDYRRNLRSEIYYCQRYGAEEHLRRLGSSKWMTEYGPDAGRYLQYLLGKINYVLQINPEDEYFQQARKEIRNMQSTFSELYSEEYKEI